ncbi:PREDICTED: uncharacterized protein LOC104706140 [Camelina sativa]|uniref:Uncharacterized protein LOC104706140 n=1 Tax=Camelina sativa TaxID=90675 RepID=A0ABM0T453_CAMSA|nr:PREDICTED: uncharacterized protein LOC104706140 [Camelina sativa]
MEPADSSPPPRDTSEQNSIPSPNGEPETWVENFKKVATALDLAKRLSSKIRETTSEFSLQREEYEKEVELKEKLFTERFVELKRREERVKLVEEREIQVELAEASISERSSALEEKENECDMKQFLGDNVMRELKEKHGELMREFDARENELRFLDETISEKSNALEKKEVDFQLFLELKEKKLEEREKKLELKQREVEERSTNAETCKRSRVESVSANKGRDSESLIPPGKKHKSITELYHASEEKKSVLHVKRSSAPASAPESEHTSEAKRREAYEIVCIDETDDEDPEPFTCPDPDFNDFNNEMSSFAVDQIWALYDPIDDMPQYYAQIRRILKDMTLRVRWLESVQTTEHEELIPVACGRFKYGKTENKSLLMFSHKMNHITRGKNVTIIPREGETWALFTDWTKAWNSHREQHKPPYKYDFVEVLSEFDSEQGIGVAYLGRVEGFTSVYKLAAQHGIVQIMIGSDEMLRFSHRVPSYKLIGDEEEGVPAGYFELDPAAIPRAYLKATKVEEEKIRI